MFTGGFPKPPPIRASERNEDGAFLRNRLTDMSERTSSSLTSSTLNSIEENQRIRDLEKQLRRRWQTGDIYAPHDLSAAEARKWKVMSKPTLDAFDVLGMNPMDEYKVCICECRIDEWTNSRMDE